MKPTYEPRLSLNDGSFFPPPYSSPHLPPSLRNGLVSIGLFATLSAVSTILLIGFIVYRCVSWRLHYRTFVGYNQYVVLVLNLLIADHMQSAAFMVSWHWYRHRHILAPSAACFTQGWLLQSGDVSSAFFVLAIALHTYYTGVYGRRLGHKTFVAVIIAIWAFVYFLTAIGLGVHPEETYFVGAGAWCWISSAYELDRLWCHYVWVFAVQFGTIFIYLLVFYRLRRKTRQMLVHGQSSPGSPNGATLRAINRVALLMTLYPCVYILLTLPLSAGRMWSMNHSGAPTSDAFSCIAGSLMTSCGWVDSLLYTLTRKRLLQDTMSHSSGRNSALDDESHEMSDKGNSAGQVRSGHTQHRSVVNFDANDTLDDERHNTDAMTRARACSQASSVDPILDHNGNVRYPSRAVSSEDTWKIPLEEDEKQLREQSSTTTWPHSVGRRLTVESC